MGDEWNTQRALEAAKMRKLMDDFDKDIFLDETGSFKCSNSDVEDVIHCDDINPLGNAVQNQRQGQQETIHGFNTEDLIEIQNMKLIEDEPTSSLSQAQKNPESSSATTTECQPQNKKQTSHGRDHKNYTRQQNQNKNYRSWERQNVHPRQQPGIQQPHGLINRPHSLLPTPIWPPMRLPPPPPPFWYQSFVPPQFPQQNPYIRNVHFQGRGFQNGQVYPGAFNLQNFQRTTRPGAQRFHSSNVFHK